MEKPPAQRPLVSYYGGKQRMASKIVPLLPEHTVYVEPFAGGAAILFAKPWPRVKSTDHYREVLNDTCKDLFNLYSAARNHPARLADMIRNTSYGREDHASARELLRDTSATSIDRAWAYYVVLQQSFANVSHGGWGTSVFTQNAAVNWCKRDHVASISRLREVFVENKDAVDVIQAWDSPQTLFYCDPPYVGTDMGPYSGYTEKQFNGLKTALNKAQGSYVLSCYKDVSCDLDGAVSEFCFPSRCSASSQGTTGSTRDKSSRVTLKKLGHRSRIERVYRRFNTHPWRAELENLRKKGSFSCFVSKDGQFNKGLWQ